MSERALVRRLQAAGAAFVVAFTSLPIALMLVTSLAGAPDFLQRGELAPTLAHYLDLASAESIHFGRSLVNSFAVSSVASAAAVLIAASAAYAVTRIRFRGRDAMLVFVLAASSFPQISLVGDLFRMMTRAGLLNTRLALILPYTAWALPLSLWILTSFIGRIPRELDEAAQVDGCSRFDTLRLVILPLAAPGLVSALLLAFISCYNEFLFALMLTTDYRARTAPVVLASFEGLHGEIPWNGIMAASIVTILPVVALTLFFQRRIVQGLTRGAVKE